MAVIVDRLQRSSLVGLIVDRLRSEILAGKYRPGSSLPPERELARRFGVNRTSVKHALMKLEQMGFIDIKHGVGSLVLDYVAGGGLQLLEHLLVRGDDVDIDLLRDVLELRVLVGGMVAQLAAARPENASLLVEVLAAADDANCDATATQALDMEFFRALAAASGNRALMLLLNSLAVAYARSSQAFVHAFGDSVTVRAGLRSILAAIQAGDAPAARAAAEAHLRITSDLMLAGWRDNQATRPQPSKLTSGGT